MGLFKRKPPIDPTELEAMRNVLGEVWARLDESEIAKASLEDRLSSLTATTMVLSSTAQNDTAEIVEKIVLLEGRLERHAEVDGRLLELDQRVAEVEQRQPVVDSGETTSAEGAVASGGISGGVDLATEFVAELILLSERIDLVAELAASPAQPDDELAARLDELGRSAEMVDALNHQLALLTSQVNSQAEMADQLTALSNRISLLQQSSVDADELSVRLAALAAAQTHAEGFDDRSNELTSRSAANEEQQRSAAEQVELVEQRAVSDTEPSQIDQVQAELRMEIESLRTQIDAQPDVVLPDLTQVTAQLAQLAERLAASEHDHRATRQEMTTKLTAQAISERSIANVHERLTASEHDARAAREMTVSLEQRIDQQIVRAPNAALAAAGIGDELVELRRRIDVDLAAVNARLNEYAPISEQLADLRSTVDGHRDLPGALIELRSQMADDAALSAVSAQLEALRVQVDEAGLSATHGDDQLAITAQLDALRSHVDETRSAFDQLRETHDQLNDQREVEARLASLQSQLDEQRGASAEIHELRDRVDTQSGLPAQLSELGARVDREIGNVHDRIASQGDVSGQFDDLRHRLDEQRHRIGEYGTVAEQIQVLHDRIDEQRELPGQLDELRHRLEEHNGVASQLAELGSRVDRELGDVRHRIDEHDGLPDQLASLNVRLSELGDHRGELDRLHDRVDEIGAALASTDAISDQLRELTQRAGLTQAATDETRAQVAAVEQRLASASTELANQIGELGREIDGLATREVEPVNVTLDDAATATLRNGQVRLASEQARFEISFREDLATLAEQVRQLRGRG